MTTKKSANQPERVIERTPEEVFKPEIVVKPAAPEVQEAVVVVHPGKCPTCGRDR